MNGHPSTVLLIEDNPGDAALIREYLSEVEGSPFSLEHVDRVSLGLSRMKKGGIAIILLDLSLPDSHGLDTIDRIVAESETVPVLVLTGLDDKEMGLAAVSKGAQDFLVKGKLTATGIIRAIRYTIERRRLETERFQHEQELRLVMEQIPGIVWTTDKELRCTSCFGAALELVQLQPSELLGKTAQEFFQTDDEAHPIIAAERQSLRGELVSLEFQWRERTFEICIRPLSPDGNHIIGVIGISMDITDARRVEEDFRAAGKIQQQFLPKVAPQLAGFDIAGICKPAASTGGDYFDYIPLRDGTLGIVIADVSNHGFAPALIMASTRRLLRTLATIHDDLGEVLTAANQAIQEDIAEHFVTLFFARLDPKTRMLNYIGAAHDAYIMDPSGDYQRLPSDCLPLGVELGKITGSHPPVHLKAGSMLILVTDGLLDAMGPEGKRFGTKCAMQIAHAHRDKTSDQILHVLLDAVRDYCKPNSPHDDITIVIVKVE